MWWIIWISNKRWIWNLDDTYKEESDWNGSWSISNSNLWILIIKWNYDSHLFESKVAIFVSSGHHSLSLDDKNTFEYLCSRVIRAIKKIVEVHMADNISQIIFLVLEWYCLTWKKFSISFDKADNEAIKLVCQPSNDNSFFSYIVS